jgi:hypothetical protein
MNLLELQRRLNQPYSTENWKEVVQEVFPNVQLLNPVLTIPVDNPKVESFRQLGNVRLQDGKSLALFELKLKSNVNILRNRVELNNLVSQYIDQEQNHGVLSIFEQGGEDYRFTFSARATEFDESEADFVTKKTDTKRFTYVLGKNESCKTPAQRLHDLSTKKESADINTIQDAFSVEKLSIEFFAEYKVFYEQMVNYLNGSPSYKSAIFKGDEKAIRDFVKLTLGRLVFIQFLQKKRWIGVPAIDPGWDSGDPYFLKHSFQNFTTKETFYSNFLEPLFFETLNKDGRPNQLFPITGTKVPYLNGGLFEKGKENSHLINFPVALFEELFEFFNRYNFTIDESDPKEQEVGIDPEMLGHIFENLLEDNKDKGAFYTPKEIVHYMCQESLLEYLKTFLEEKGKWPTTEEDQLVLEEDLSNFIKKKEGAGIIDYDRELAIALRDVKICDPAIGSGAFPMGLLNEIFHAVYILFQASPDVVGKEWGMNEWKPNVVKKNIIQGSIYGVDIEKGAVDIARLRFWLSLIVDEPEPEALPNLDYKIVVGNSLISKMGDVMIDIDWNLNDTSYGLFGEALALRKVDLLKKISAEQKEFFNPESDKKKLSVEIRNLKIDLLINQLELMIKTKGLDNRPSNTSKKITEQTTLYLQTLGWKDSIRQLIQLKSEPETQLSFFDWKLDFPEVFGDILNSKPGFDLVIGNPPYVSNKGVNDEIKNAFGFSDDLYNYFFIKGYQTLRENGIFCYITSNTFLTLQTKLNIRELLLNNDLKSIVNLGHDVFESAMVSTAITIFKKKKIIDSIIKFLDSRGKTKLSKATIHYIDRSEYIKTPNFVLFTPNEYNLRIHKKYSQKIKLINEKYWDKISTSRNIQKNLSEIKNYQKDLKEGDVSIIGLLTDGGQGLATANNGKFIGVTIDTKEGQRTIFNRIKKIKEFNAEFNKNYSLDNLNELQIRELFDDIKEKYGRDVFGQGFLYRVIDSNEKADLSSLTQMEISSGIKNKNSFVPYEKGDKDGNRWYLETPYFIDWNVENVSFLKRNSGKKGKGMPVVRNQPFYFREGFCWSDIHTVLIKARLKGISIHDVKSMSLFPMVDSVSAKYLVCFLNSKFASEFSFEFLNNTSSLQINDARSLPIVIPSSSDLTWFESLFDDAHEIQKQKFSKKINEEKAESLLNKIQVKLDQKIDSIYL